jgi:predicted NAD/FAD-binding protein
VETVQTDMSFGVSTPNRGFEWGSTSLKGFIGKLSLLFSAWWWRFIFDILRFSLFAQDALNENLPPMLAKSSRQPGRAAVLNEDRQYNKTLEPETIGEYLVRKGYSGQFIWLFLIPMVAAPWCIDPVDFARSFPATLLIQFMFVKQCPRISVHSSSLIF